MNIEITIAARAVVTPKLAIASRSHTTRTLGRKTRRPQRTQKYQ